MTTLEERAASDANNHAAWSFWWRSAPENKHLWTIWYVTARDATITTQSNAAAIAEIMEPLAEADTDSETVLYEEHGCSLMGWHGGWVIRVFNDDGSITSAYQAAHALQCRLEDYYCLNEDDVSTRESDATWENLKESATHFVADGTAVDDVLCDLATWLSANVPNWDESLGDQGGYPDDDDIVRGLRELGKCDEAEVAAQAHPVG